MKKFIYFLFVMMCVAAPFALVSCSDDDDEGGGTSAGSSDYLEVTLDGKTYMEDIPAWGYVYLDGTETDSEGNRVSIVNVVIDSFGDQYGFSFLPSIAYYSMKDKLMTAEPGAYLHKNRFGNIWDGEYYCENFTMVSDVEIGTSYYELVSGTHQIRSVRSVGNEVQIEGTFDGVYKCDKSQSQCEVQGKYRMTLDVRTSANPLD